MKASHSHFLRHVALLLLAVLCTFGHGCRRSRTPPPQSPIDESPAPLEGPIAEATQNPGPNFAAEFLALVNKTRAQYDAPPIAIHPTVQAVAQTHSNNMADQNKLSQVLADGRDSRDRLMAAGINPPPYGLSTILGRYFGSAASLHSRLLEPGYIQILTARRWTHLGVGLARPGNGNWWTVIFVQL